MRNIPDKRCRENQNNHFKFSDVFPEVVPFMKYCGKYGRARQATDDNMAHPLCALDT